MLSKTHKLISDMVLDTVKTELNIDINDSSFKRGSIAPDFYPKMMLKPHDKEGVRFGLKRIDELMKHGIPSEKKDIRKLSFRLGVLSHFVSDYFCKPHNGSKHINIVLHYIYERRLKKFFIRSLVGDNTSICLADYTEWQSVTDVERFIFEKNIEYNSHDHSMAKDFAYSTEVSLAVILSLLAVCMRNPGNISPGEAA